MTEQGADQAVTIPNSPTLTVAQAARVLGVSEWALRRSLNAGTSQVQSVRIGRRVLILTAPLRRMLGEFER